MLGVRRPKEVAMSKAKIASLRQRAEVGEIDAMYEYGLTVDDPGEKLNKFK